MDARGVAEGEQMARERAVPLVRALLAGLLCACLALVSVSSAEAAKRKRPAKRAKSARVNPQLRGVELTPNRAYTVTGEAFSEAENAREMQSACALGANVVRVVASWAWLEKSAPGAADSRFLTRLDALMADANRCGIRVLLMFGGTPRWASDSGSEIAPPRDVDQFRRVVGFVLRRFPALYALEVWNEPNLSQYWGGTPRQYADLVNAAVAAKRDVGTSTKILGGTLAMGATGYLQELYSAGLRGEDGISLHPYSMLCTPVCTRFEDPRGSAAPFRTAIESIHQVMVSNGDPASLWLTEFGFPTCPAQPGCVSDDVQASWTAQSVRVAACYPYIEGLTAFTLRDIPVPESWDESYFEFHFGLMDANFNPKPAFAAVRTAYNELNGLGVRALRASKRARGRKRRPAVVPGAVGSKLCLQVAGRTRPSKSKKTRRR